MKTLLVLGLAAGALTPITFSTPATAVGETCQGRPATIVGSPGAQIAGAPGDDVIVTNGASWVVTQGDDLVCTTNTAAGATVTVAAANSQSVTVDRRGDLDPAARGNAAASSGAFTFYGGPGTEHRVGEPRRIGGLHRRALRHLDRCGRGRGVHRRLGRAARKHRPRRGRRRARVARPTGGNISFQGGPGHDHLDLTAEGGEWQVDAGHGVIVQNAGSVAHLGGFEAFLLRPGR